MATPFINVLLPTRLDTYEAGQPRERQPASVPSTFLDAMEVRNAVYVDEQGVVAEHEFDNDDPRSCHWVVYASVNVVDSHEKLAADGVTVITPRRSSTRTTPIGTIRAVPFPHPPHPRGGRSYVHNMPDPSNQESQPKSEDDGPAPRPRPGYGSRPHYAPDKPTDLHDGHEPYIKLGRLAVIKEFRGHHVASLLVKSALDWLRENSSRFDPSVAELGLEQIGAASGADIPRWRGLVCVHAQDTVVGFWEKWGFKRDAAMGAWTEDGLPHVGMFHRMDLDKSSQA